MLKLTIEVAGDTVDDLSLGLEETARLLVEGFTSGYDRNESGRYRFEVVDESVDETVDEVMDLSTLQLGGSDGNAS